LLTLCSIVLLRKSSGGLDLLTEAQVVRRFPRLRSDLGALYAAYYVAELLADWTEECDPHPALFDEAVATLGDLGTGDGAGLSLGPRVVRFELVLLRELGYQPVLDRCVNCGGAIGGQQVMFAPEAGGVSCPRCPGRPREARPVSAAGVMALRELLEEGDAWRRSWDEGVRVELRQVLGLYVTYVRGRRPRLLPYLGS
jgi:DNA repair protein RecO (recombination protein O)